MNKYLLLSAIMSLSLNAIAQDSLSLFPNIHTIGVSVYNKGGNDYSLENATLEYKSTNEASFRTGLPLSKVYDATGANVIRFSGSIFWLSPRTAYDVRVTITGLSGTRVLTGTVTTLAQPSVASAAAKIYYVSPNGNDTACTSQSPGNLSFALSRVKAGEMVMCKAGTYRVSGLQLANNASGNKFITIRAEAGAEVIFEGGYDVPSNSWTSTNTPGLFYTVVPDSMANSNLVTANGRRLYPYRSLNNLIGHNISCIIDNPVLGIVNPAAANLDGFFRDPRVTTTIPFYNCYNWWGTYNPALCNPAFRRFYVKFTDNSHPSNKQVVISRGNDGLLLKKKSNIRISGIIFRNYGNVRGWEKGRGLEIDSSSNILVNTCKFQYCDVGVLLRGKSDKVVIQQCTFEDNTDWETYIGKATYDNQVNIDLLCVSGTSPDLFYMNTRLLETGGLLVDHKYTGRGLIVRNNTFNGLMDGLKLVPPTTPDTDTREVDFHNNRIMNTVDAMEVDGMASNVRIWSNTFSNGFNAVSMATAGYGPVYFLRNTVYDLKSSVATVEGQQSLFTFRGGPLKLSGARAGNAEIHFYHNTVCAKGDNLGHGSSLVYQFADAFARLNIKNNIFVSQNNTALNIDVQGTRQWMDKVDADNNCYFRMQPGNQVSYWAHQESSNTLNWSFAQYQQELQKESSSIYANPLFGNMNTNNYKLKANSPAIDKGIFIPGINTHNYSGLAPDMGANEVTTTTATSSARIADELEETPVISLYPNPNKGQFNLRINGVFDGNAEWMLMDVSGKQISRGMIPDGISEQPIVLDDLTEGYYIVVVKNDKGYIGQVNWVKM